MYLLSAPSLTPAGQGLSWFTDEPQGAWEVIDDYLLSKWTDEWMDWWMDGWMDGWTKMPGMWQVHKNAQKFSWAFEKEKFEDQM